MSRLIRETEADGVVLDTRGSSSVEIQEAADSVRDGVVMYSEGMAVVEDMPGIVSGRVHNAIFKSPELNLNKIIKPEFALFRVCDVGEAILHREIAIAFFNGYGTELNLYRPGRYHNIENDYNYLARTTMLLRQNNDAFLDSDWVPLTPDSKKKLHINKWTAGDKTIYTVLNMDHKGFNGPAVTVDTGKGKHYVSIWHHNELNVINNNGRKQLAVNTGSYPEKYTGTRKEASIDCIAAFPIILESRVSNDTLYINSDERGDLKVWNCNPAYSKSPYETEINDSVAVDISEVFPDYEGKIVIQLFRDKLLADERIVEFRGGRPWLISEPEKTPAHTGRIPGNMVLVPSAEISYKPSSNDDFIPYPLRDEKMVEIDSFLIDRYPVTNEDYYRFILESGYSPRDTVNYLKHWDNGIYQQGKEKYPVVNISLEDARAYASWAGKRLPTELEWQLAAQGTDGRSWPWGNEFHGTKCNNSFDRSTPVDAFRKGQSPYGVMDMVGNVWQLTGDVYDNGSYYFVIIRGGSYYKPESSWWYIQGGPQPLDKTQMLLLVSPGFDRSSTLGFRCVKDM